MLRAIGDLVSIPSDCEKIVAPHGFVYLMLVPAKMNGRTHLQVHTLLAGEQCIPDVDRVLTMDEQYPFLNHHSFHLEPPNGRLFLETEFGRVMVGRRSVLGPGRLLAGDLNQSAVWKF